MLCSLLSADMELQKCVRKKRILFHGEAKMYENAQKQAKKEYCKTHPN